MKIVQSQAFSHFLEEHCVPSINLFNLGILCEKMKKSQNSTGFEAFLTPPVLKLIEKCSTTLEFLNLCQQQFDPISSEQEGEEKDASNIISIDLLGSPLHFSLSKEDCGPSASDLALVSLIIYMCRLSFFFCFI